MTLLAKQISSMEKVRNSKEQVLCIEQKTLMRGETFSYQVMLTGEENKEINIRVESALKEHIRLYCVKNAVMDFPICDDADEDYLTKTPGLMPDILLPLDMENATVWAADEVVVVWVTVTIPESVAAGEYVIKVSFVDADMVTAVQTMTLNIINTSAPKQKTIFTQWFHADCIANVHKVSIYSPEHWELIDQYMHLASQLGINMLLTPVITPPLDVEQGHTRPCTQLVKIRKQQLKYFFDFSLLERWVALCQKNHIQYIEFSHLFSQWGLKYAPNIKVEEGGKESYMFGWHTEARSPAYREFLQQFLPALVAFCESKGIRERCWFHISDEPGEEDLETYEYAYNLVKPLIGDMSILDAISNYAFYEKGYIKHPVSSINHIHTFIDHKTKNQWAYYCCAEHKNVGNRFLAMPSYRNRILGLQMYKYDIEGFLQWGYNFYNSELSRKSIDPYKTTSAEGAFPSGDPFSVYPTEKGAMPSVRAVVFREALNDIAVCRKLESYIGKEAVVKMIDSEAGMDVTFYQYPRNSAFIPTLIEKMENMIECYTKKGALR